MLGDWQEDWVVTFTITVQPTEANHKRWMILHYSYNPNSLQ